MVGERVREFTWQARGVESREEPVLLICNNLLTRANEGLKRTALIPSKEHLQ
jgi:hypothetical protein